MCLEIVVRPDWSDLPGPKKAKTFPMPGNHRLGLDEENGRAPVGPDSA